jgi:hypothetical protein
MRSNLPDRSSPATASSSTATVPKASPHLCLRYSPAVVRQADYLFSHHLSAVIILFMHALDEPSSQDEIKGGIELSGPFMTPRRSTRRPTHSTSSA